MHIINILHYYQKTACRARQSHNESSFHWLPVDDVDDGGGNEAAAVDGDRQHDQDQPREEERRPPRLHAQRHQTCKDDNSYWPQSVSHVQ